MTAPAAHELQLVGIWSAELIQSIAIQIDEFRHLECRILAPGVPMICKIAYNCMRIEVASGVPDGGIWSAGQQEAYLDTDTV